MPVDDGTPSQVLTTNGTGTLSWTTPSGTGANTALSNLASVAINTTLVSDTNSTDDLGTSSIAWKDLYLNGSIKTASTTFLTFGSSMVANTALAMSSNKITGLAAASASGDAVRFEQIYYGFQAAVQATTVTDFSTTSNAFQTTNLSASITPTSSAHRIKITITGGLQINAGANVECFATIFRDSTDLGGAAGDGFTMLRNQSGAVANRGAAAMVYIDSPASTSSITYSVKIRNSDNATSVHGFASGDLEKCTIILEEII